MKLARLAASKQQGSYSPAGPVLVPRAEGVPKSKTNVTTLSGMVFRNRFGNIIFLVGPPLVGNSGLAGVWPSLGRRHLEKFRAQAKNRKMQFPGTRGPETGKKNTTLSGMGVRNFLTV